VTVHRIYAEIIARYFDDFYTSFVLAVSRSMYGLGCEDILVQSLVLYQSYCPILIKLRTLFLFTAL